jgi:ankyrin repeat protein
VDFDDAGGIPKLKPDWRWEDEEQGLLIACSSLIAVVQAGRSRVVQFSHFSVKEFLTSTRLAASDYHIDLAPANTTLAEACVGVLLQTHKGTANHPLAQYAAQNWTTHTQIGDVSSRLRKGMDYFFDPENPHFKVWRRLYDIDTWLPFRSIFDGFAKFPISAPAPLYYAALCGFQDLVQHLIIKYPRDVNASGGHYVTPLVAALAGKHFQTADLLRRNGADPHFRNHLMQTPLHSAASNGDLEVVQKLIEYDANINAKNIGWHRHLHFASSKVKGGSVLRLLLKNGAHLNERDIDGSSPLHKASYSGALEVVRLLLEHGADVNAREKDGSTPLCHASSNTSLEVARLLLEHGADVNARRKDGSTPLRYASFEVSLEVARLLLENGPYANAREKDGSTPLHYASSIGSLEVARLLLEHGADVNAREKGGSTPLHRASRWGYLEVVRLLLGHGADVKAVDNRGMTAFHIVETRNHGEYRWVSETHRIEVLKLLEHKAK